MIAFWFKLAAAAVAVALLLTVVYLVYLASVAGLIQIPILAGVSGESAAALGDSRVTSTPASFTRVLEASAVVESPQGWTDIGISAVAFNHYVATGGRASPQLEWARARVTGASVAVEGELRGHLNVPFAGHLQTSVDGQELVLHLAVERFGVLPLPQLLLGDGVQVRVPANRFLLSLLGLGRAAVG